MPDSAERQAEVFTAVGATQGHPAAGDDYALASLMEAALGVEVTSFEKLT